MPFGTLERNAPPLFRQGPSALTRLLLCAAFAVFLMVLDARFKVAQPARAAVALVLDPVQRLLLSPVDAWENLGDYLRGMEKAMAAEDLARRQLAAQAERLARAQQLQAENQRLRELLKMQQAQAVSTVAAEVLYEAPDPYSRRVSIDRGSRHGVHLGSPVITEAGVLGQVTRVYTFSSEVTLVTDKDAAIPVLNTRTQQRGVAFGGEQGLELRFTAANADIQTGDVLSTSGLDGVYPPGLPVARVARVERRSDTSFARVSLHATVPVDSVRHVLVLAPLAVHEAARAEAAEADSREAQALSERKAQARADARQRAAEQKAAREAGKEPAGSASAEPAREGVKDAARDGAARGGTPR